MQEVCRPFFDSVLAHNFFMGGAGPPYVGVLREN